VIAEHGHISEVSASLGQSLLRSRKGTEEVERFIREDREDAELHGVFVEAQEL
jgi:hypothetical protein